MHLISFSFHAVIYISHICTLPSHIPPLELLVAYTFPWNALVIYVTLNALVFYITLNALLFYMTLNTLVFYMTFGLDHFRVLSNQCYMKEIPSIFLNYAYTHLKNRNEIKYRQYMS